MSALKWSVQCWNTLRSVSTFGLKLSEFTSTWKIV